MPDPAMISTSGLNLHISTLEDATVVQCRGTLTVETSDFLKGEVKNRIPSKGRLVLARSFVRG